MFLARSGFGIRKKGIFLSLVLNYLFSWYSGETTRLTDDPGDSSNLGRLILWMIGSLLVATGIYFLLMGLLHR